MPNFRHNRPQTLSLVLINSTLSIIYLEHCVADETLIYNVTLFRVFVRRYLHSTLPLVRAGACVWAGATHLQYIPWKRAAAATRTSFRDTIEGSDTLPSASSTSPAAFSSPSTASPSASTLCFQTFRTMIETNHSLESVIGRK